MPLHVDLGFSGAALLLVFFFGPVVALVVRRRWRLVTARQEEVRRLAYLAAQEAALAEMDAMAAYSATSSEVTKESVALPECAVCSSPAGARCARCKAVRYCSGRCQIIHWRQGHKDECQPPPVNDKDEDKLSSSSLKGVHSKPSGLSEKRLDPKEDLTSKVETHFERPFASKSTSTDDEIDGDIHQNSSSKDISANKTFSGSSSPTIPAQSTFPQTISSPDDAYAKKLISNNVGLEESPSFGIYTVGLRTAVDTSNVTTTMSSTPELATSNPLANFTTHSSRLRVETSTCKTEVDEQIPSNTSALKNTSSHDQVSTEQYERVGNGIKSSTSSTPEGSSPRAASLEARSHSEGNETQTSKKETSRFLASASDHYSTNGGAKSVPFYERSNGNAHRASIGSKNIPHVANGLSTSLKQVVTKVSRHYSSEFMLFPYDLFIKLYNSDKIDLRPCGLINCGNSCYANAVLQCLAFTRPLTAYFLDGLHSRICPKKEWCFTCELESLVRNAKEGKSPLSPIGILSHLHNIGSNFGHGQQEDAHEFLRYAIEAMQSICLKEAVAKPDGLLEETTLIQQTFGGYLRSKIRCSKCKSKSERCERMMDLTVEIDGDIVTLDDALLRFTSQEILDGENKYKCERCKSYERAKKRLTILEAPNVLTIVLKRFQSGKFGKLNKAVRFSEYLDLARYMSGDDKSPVYRLYAVIVHIDTMNASFSGHYVCYVKDRHGKWYKIDDSKVQPVELEVVLSKGAYMLLYARCLPRGPSSVRRAMAQLVHARKNMKDGKGNRGDLSVAHHGEHYSPYLSNLRPHPNDSASDSSSLFDEGSTCSTESTRDSTSTEESWEHTSGESDSFSSNSPLRISEDSDGLTRSPLGSRHSLKANRPTPSTMDLGSNATSSGREAEQAGMGSFLLYPDNSQLSRNLVEHRSRIETDRFRQNEGNSGVLLRRPTRERTAQTFC
ncbi:ubiquitin carboxyl-terminal hydrolase 17-like [Zingiber officinale]|uniref:ubiquitinyl hydrolase 1 n=1 Tax=Zingiber officinale TaxID=94328 RepID=A0A8J5I1J4_ZINOF|nr:ubiquitin carboxyl-terminal hydrolase 17-like [Zingiber officinale]KAG6539082.1 hypothetical protein ZIOFF_004235 [Zingiber officinale]